MNKYMTATALALALGFGAAAGAQTQGQARGGEAMAQSGGVQTPAQPGSTAAASAWYGGMSADELIGKDVRNANGEQVADIEDIVLDSQGEAIYAVLSVGGFLGIGEKDVAVPFGDLRMGADNVILMSQQSEEQLKALPAYEKDRYRQVERGRTLDTYRK